MSVVRDTRCSTRIVCTVGWKTPKVSSRVSFAHHSHWVVARRLRRGAKEWGAIQQ